MISNINLQTNIFNNFLWKFLERVLAQGISFVITILLARFLLPSEYGTVVLVMVFITIANVFVTEGFGTALIQKKDSDELDFSTMLVCSLLLSVFIYILLFTTAPFVSVFFNEPCLTNLLRVVGLLIPLSAIKTIQHSFVEKHMLFRKFFFSTLLGSVLSGILGVGLAFYGFGAWALVVQYLTNSFVDMVVLFFTVDWRPQFKFSKERASCLLPFGSKIVFVNLINTLYGQSRNIIIGKIYTSADLAFINKGNQFPNLFIENINSSISSVLFPALSMINDNRNDVKSLTRKSLIISSYVIFPLMFGLMSISDNLVRLLLTDAWEGCVPFLQISCIYWMFQPCLTANYQVLKAMGEGNLCLKLEIIKKLIGIVLIIISMDISVLYLALSNVLFAFLSTIINAFPNKRIINYGFFDQLLDIAPSFFISFIMAIASYSISNAFEKDLLLNLLSQITISIVVYFFLSVTFKLKAFLMMKEMCLNGLKKFTM